MVWTPVFTEVMTLTALIVGPGTIAWAIIKYRFLDIGLIARQSLVYTLTRGKRDSASKTEG